VSALAAATEAYQAMLEGHRHDPDNEDLFEDLLKARAEMETAWLEHTAPDWPEGDPRWQVLLDIRPASWQLNFGDAVVSEARRRLAAMRSQALRELLASGRITRPQLADALGVRMIDLDDHLADGLA
jgi:hypothetical protein